MIIKYKKLSLTLGALVLLGATAILSQTKQRHTHKEWLQFLKHLDEETPTNLDLHLIIDNYATHKHPKVKA